MTDPIPNPRRLDDAARLTPQERDLLIWHCDDAGCRPQDLLTFGHDRVIDTLPESLAAKVWMIRQRREGGTR